jgi:glucan phosphoethanolaminetransferase (alkaline phosphatase superfamily)
MGLANIPGYKLWKSGARRNNNSTANIGIFLGWIGQSAVSLCFALTLVLLTRLFFRHFEFHFLFQWLYCIAIFCLSLGPAYRTLRVSEQTTADDAEKTFYRLTLILTLATTALGFAVFVISPLRFL